MTPLEAARRLDMLRTRQSRMICVLCKKPFSEGERGHADDCPLLALPRIVAALELAAQTIPTMPDTSVFLGHGKARHCRFCNETPYRHGQWVGPHHKSDCPWPALVAALRGEG